MAALFIFGLQCPLVASGSGFTVLPPAGMSTRDSFWGRGALKIGSDSRLTGQVSLKLQGLPVKLNFLGLALTRTGNDFRPRPEADGASVILTMGVAPGQQGRVRVGPAILDSFIINGFEQSGNSVALLGSGADLLTGNYKPVRSPLSLMIGAGKAFKVDLGKRQLLIPIETIVVDLSAHGPMSGDRKSATFTNDREIAISFAEIATSKAWTLQLKRTSGEVPLNIPERFEAVSGAFPRAPVAAVECRLGLRLESTGKPGALLTAASLAPQDGVTTLALQGLRNARNYAEHWATGEELGLVFRAGSGSVWSTPLLAPADERDLPKFRRKNDLADGKVMPLHCWFGASQFMPQSPAVTARMICDKNHVIQPKDLVPGIDRKLQFRGTRPWLRFENTSFHHSRPGESYQGKANIFVFKTTAGYCGGAPMLPRSVWEAGEDVTVSAALRMANDAVNAAFGAMVLQPGVSVHETGLGDRTNGPGQPPSTPPEIAAVVPDSRVGSGIIQLGKNDRRIDMASPRLATPRLDQASGQLVLTPPGSLMLPITIPEKTAPEFAVLWPDQDGSMRPWVELTEFEKWAKEIAGSIDPAAPIAIADLLKDNNRPRDFPLAILKISRRCDLNEILGEIASALPAGAKLAFEAKRKALVDGTNGAIGKTDPAVGEAAWVGLILFDAPIDFDAFPLLKTIIPSDSEAPRFSFVAVSPREAGGAHSDIAISAAIDWKNRDRTEVLPLDQKQEATYKPVSLAVGFRDRRMTRFQAKAELTFYSFFGVKSQSGQPGKPIDIVGSAKRIAGSRKDDGAFEIRFAAEVRGGEKLVLFPLNGQVSNADNTFLKTAWLKRIEVIDAPKDGGGRKAEIEMDGSLEFGKPTLINDGELADFFKGLNAVDFSGLRIDLPDVSSPVPRLLELRYPSLRFNLDLPHIGLVGDALKLKFRQLALDWEPGFNAFDLQKFPRLPIPGTGNLDLSLPKILFVGRLEFGSLPELFSRSLSGFSLEGLFGFNVDSGKFLPDFKPFVGIGGVGFEGLNFDLASFMKLRIKELRLGRAPWKNGASGAALHIREAWLDVAGIEVLQRGSGAFFSQDRDAGNGFWAAFRGRDFSLFEFDWAFIGQNIDFPPSIPQRLLAPPPEGSESQNFAELSDEINNAWGNGEIVPATGTAAKGWTFAASIQALDKALNGRVLFQDGGFTGLSLGGPALKKLLNWDFAFTGIYRKDISPGEDYFYFSVTLPAMTFGSMQFTGGVIAAEFYTSGDFMVDIGFPWRASGGGRQWNRTIGAIVTPGQASGGFYIKKRRTDLPEIGKSELVLGGGVAIQWGLGAAFDGGVFRVWVRIGVYVIVEGSLALQYSESGAEIVAFTLQGAAGILLEGEGWIDWWIISVTVGVRASAEIRAALIWDGRGNSPDKRVLMPIEAELSVSAYAEACIGGGCARICRSIKVSLNIPVRYQLVFG